MKLMRAQFTKPAFVAVLQAFLPAEGAERPDVIPFPATAARTVSAKDMARIYEEVKTPFKYGMVVTGDGNGF